MRRRALALGAALWTCGYAVAYLAVVHGQGNEPAWWYVAVLAVAVGLLLPAVLGRSGDAVLAVATALLAGCTVLGLLSVGLLLLPAVGGAVAALVIGRRRRWTGIEPA